MCAFGFIASGILLYFGATGKVPDWKIALIIVGIVIAVEVSGMIILMNVNNLGLLPNLAPGP
ncbi:MAG: hypothetical protein ACTSRW_16240 [Candidatus Helarchaeota archaeon]